MKTRHIWMGIALLLSVLLLATCGGDSGTTPAPPPAPAPAPAPAPTPAPEPEPELPETATYEFTTASITPNYASPGSLLSILGAQPFPEGASSSDEVAFVAHPLGTTLWEVGGMASEGLEHLAYDGHAHDLTDEAEAMGWMVIAEDFSTVQALLAAGELELSAEFPCLSYAQQLDPSPDWFIGFNVCAIHDDNGELHWEETLEVRAEMYDAGVRDGEPYMDHTGTTDPQEPITRLMLPPWDTDAVLELTATLRAE